MATSTRHATSGFTDKNGTEIHEGDLLKEYWPGGYTVNRVIFDDRRLDGWEAEYMQAYKEDGTKIEGRFSRYLPLEWINEKSEVIGGRRD